MTEIRALHLQGSLGTPRTEWLGDREYLVVPTVALIGDNVIHAVNAPEAEFVPASILSADGWDRRPLMLGHPTKDGVQISANDPDVLRASSFGFTANPKLVGKRLGMESWCDVQKLEALGQHKMLADLRAGKPVEVSTGSFVHTRAKRGEYAGKRYAAEWASIGADHLAFLPGGTGACSMAMGCGAHRAAMQVGSDDVLRDLSNPEGINQYSHGGASSHATSKDLHAAHEAAIKHFKAEGHRLSSDKKSKGDAYGPSLRATRFSGGVAIHSHSDKLTGKHTLKIERNDLKGLATMDLKDIKARILALFGDESAAAEEAAELVAYNSMRVQLDAAGDQWDAASDLIDELISDEEENPTVTSGQEAAEEVVEDARLNAIRMHCYSAISELQSVISATLQQTAPTPSDPRYMEEFPIPEGATRVLSNPEGINQYSGGGSGPHEIEKTSVYKHAAGGRVAVIHLKTTDREGSHAQAKAKAKELLGHGRVKAIARDDMHDSTAHYFRGAENFRGLIGKEISAKNKKVIQAAHDASHDMHTHTVSLGAECDLLKAMASKLEDCTTCSGTGQVKDKDSGKQQDCPTCSGEGQVRAAEQSELRAACRCEEASVEKKDRIAALLKNEHNPIKDITDKTSDEVLAVLEASAETNKKNAEALKAAQAKQEETDAALKAAQAAQIPAEELAQLRGLAAEKQQQDATAKADLVKRLEPLKTLSKEQLEAKTLDELKVLAQFAKVEQPAADFSIRGIPVQRSAAATADSYAPPDPYNLKALQEKKPAVN